MPSFLVGVNQHAQIGACPLAHRWPRAASYLMASIVLLAGKPPKPGSVFDVVPRMLAEKGVSSLLERPHETGLLGEQGWPANALIVHRGLRRDVLVALSELEQRGWQCCNRACASLRVQDRSELTAVLDAAGLPVPEAHKFRDWAGVRSAPTTARVVIKAADGAVGRGLRVLVSTVAGLPEEAPFPGPYVVENHVENDGTDRKLYVAGPSSFGLLKPWPRDARIRPVPFEVPRELRDVAAAAGEATGLEIFGVDVLMGPEGPVVIDVNPFPSFSGVDGGFAAVARHLAQLATA